MEKLNDFIKEDIELRDSEIVLQSDHARIHESVLVRMQVTRVLEMEQLMGAKNACEQNPLEIVFGQNKGVQRRLNTGDFSKLEQLISDSWTLLDTSKLALSFKHVIPWLQGSLTLEFEYRNQELLKTELINIC